MLHIFTTIIMRTCAHYQVTHYALHPTYCILCYCATCCVCIPVPAGGRSLNLARFKRMCTHVMNMHINVPTCMYMYYVYIHSIYVCVCVRTICVCICWPLAAGRCPLANNTKNPLSGLLWDPKTVTMGTNHFIFH